MADQENDSSPKPPTQREAQEALEKQVAQLKREIAKINRTLSERAEEVVDEATGWYDSAADRAARATRQLKSQAQSVSETVQQNPATVGSAFMLGTIVGALLVTVLGSARQERDRHWF